jgi:hypothetical protein
MQDNDRLTPMDKELEAALGGLKPSGAAISRDRVMFAAGQAAARRRGRVWQGVSGLLAALLLASIVWRPGPAGPVQHVETVAYESLAALPTASPPELIDRQEMEAFRRYVRTRRAVLNRGIEAIPVSPASRNASDATLTRDDLDELLS